MTTITLPRATVEQALEALESVYGDSCDALHALRTALAQQAEPGEPVAYRHLTDVQEAILAEREAIAQSLDKQADLAADDIDRQWAKEMAAAVRARSRK